MPVEFKLNSSAFLLDDWKYLKLYDTSNADKNYAWIRLLLLRDNEYIQAPYNGLLCMAPRIEICETWTDKEQLFFTLRKFEATDSVAFKCLVEFVYPFPQQYTEPGNFEKAKDHCDKFIRAVTNLKAFF